VARAHTGRVTATRRTARDLEALAASAKPPRTARPAIPANGALAMLARRGLRPRATAPDLPFPAAMDEATAARVVDLLGHYAFRLFLRGAIQRGDGFAPEDATSYVSAARARTFAGAMVTLGLAVRLPQDRVRLAAAASSFGGVLEWYIGRELHRWLGFDVATGVKFHASGVGGDLDIVAAAEGKLVYLEVKSSPPKHLSEGEVRAFFERVDLVAPDVTLFVMDTALRLGDRVVPMLVAGARQAWAAGIPPPRRIARDLWVLDRRVYVVNSKPDLLGNIGRAIADGFRNTASSSGR
jgi:hypothetical protein